MSFQAYLTNIEVKTGKSPADFRAYAADTGWLAAGALRADVKAGTIVAYLKAQLASAMAAPWRSSPCSRA